MSSQPDGGAVSQFNAATKAKTKALLPDSESRLSPLQGEVRELAQLVAQIDEMEVWGVAYLAWKQLTLTGSMSLRAIAEAVNVGKDTVYDRIHRFEQTFHVSLRAKGEISEEKKRELERFFHGIDDLLDRFKQVRSLRQGEASGPVTIRLGAGQALCNSWVRQVARPFLAKRRDSEPPIAIDLVGDMPAKLREAGDKGLLDLYITSFPNEGEIVDDHFEIELDLQLICPYDHPIVENPDSRSLRGTTVLILARHQDRVPIPSYPLEDLEKAGARIESVDSYENAYMRMRIGDNKIACFGLPETLSEDDRREFVGIRLEKAGFKTRPDKVRIGLVNPKQAQKRRDDVLNGVVGELFDDFKKFMGNVAKRAEPAEDELLGRFNDRNSPWRCYHVRGLKDGSYWASGQLHWRFSRDGSMRGAHLVNLRSVVQGQRDQQEYRTYGRMMVNKDDKECHLAWQGVFEDISDPEKPPETYDANFVFSKDAALSGKPLVGVWQGRRTYPQGDDISHEYLPDWGYVVLWQRERELERTERTAAELKRLVDQYRTQFKLVVEENTIVPKRWEPDISL